MIHQAVILSVREDKKEATVSPLITGACLSCKEGCAQRGSPFPVSNAKNFDIKEGQIVQIAASKRDEAVQSILSLLIPVISAVAAYFAAAALSRTLWHTSASEGFKAVCVLIGILIPSGVILALSRFKIRPSKPQIEKIF